MIPIGAYLLLALFLVWFGGRCKVGLDAACMMALLWPLVVFGFIVVSPIVLVGQFVTKVYDHGRKS